MIGSELSRAMTVVKVPPGRTPMTALPPVARQWRLATASPAAAARLEERAATVAMRTDMRKCFTE
jgi:hypothetical protein